MASDVEALKAKIKAREGKPGYRLNVEHLKARLAELEGR